MLSADSVISVLQELGKNEKLDITQFEETYIKKFNISYFDDDRTMLLIFKK